MENTNISQGDEAASPIKAKQNQALEKIRPELNLEKWPIWKPAKSTAAPEVRIMEREITLPDGSKVNARVRVGYSDRGDLTTEDRNTYYALTEYWRLSGRSEQQTFFSLNRLAKLLKKKGWGTNVIESLTESLMRLRGNLFTWENSYYDSSTKETKELLDTFTILSELRIAKKKTDGTTNKAVGYFKFNDFILKNLLNNHTKPLLLDVLLELKSEIAQLLYTYLDLIMANKNHYERRTTELFQDLALKGKAYRNASNRKQKLQAALKELQGKALTTGVITLATLEETADGKDYKVVFHKSSFAAASTLNSPSPTPTPEPPTDDSREEEAQPAPASAQKDPLVEQGETLVKHFYKTFYNIEKLYPTSKEVAQAITLITTHGLEQSRYVIDFSYRTAPETGYKPQTFGGILQYTSRALAEYETKKHQHEQQTKKEVCPVCKGTGFIGVQLPEETTDRATPCQHSEEWLDAHLKQRNAKRTW